MHKKPAKKQSNILFTNKKDGYFEKNHVNGSKSITCWPKGQEPMIALVSNQRKN